MKKVIFTLLIQILVTISVAHAQGSVLNLRTTGNYLFAVQVDHQHVSAPDRNFTIQNLRLRMFDGYWAAKEDRLPGSHLPVTLIRAGTRASISEF